MAKKHAFILQPPTDRTDRDGTIEDYIRLAGLERKGAAIIMELERRTEEYARLRHYDGTDIILIENGSANRIEEYTNTFKDILSKYNIKENIDLKYTPLGDVNLEDLRRTK